MLELVQVLEHERVVDEPYLDYTRSIIVPTNDYVSILEQKAKRKVVGSLEQEHKKVEAKENEQKWGWRRSKPVLQKDVAKKRSWQKKYLRPCDQ